MGDSKASVPTEQKDLSKFVRSTHRHPGELGMAALWFLLGALGYYFALDMTHDSYSAPSVFPKLASTIIMICSAYSFYTALKLEKPESTAPSLVQYLLPLDVVFMLVLLIVYCVVLPKLHFIISSYAFMVIGITYFQRGKRVISAFIISAAALAILVAIFRYVFLVILP